MNQVPSVMMGTFGIKSQETMNSIVRCAIDNNCRGFDTSPSYGTERALGVAVQNIVSSSTICREELFIADKIDGIQIYKSKGRISKYIQSSLKEMKCEYFDSILIHWPFLDYLDTVWEELSRMKEMGIIKSLGICNVTLNKLDEIYRRIGEYPEFIQNEISPLNYDESVKFFQSNGIWVEAYSPFARMIDLLKNDKSIQEVAIKHNKDIGQIILRWNMQRGIIPIFTSTNVKRIQSNMNLYDFELDIEDMKKIRSMDIKYKIFPYSYGCPGY